ncbi:MAG: HAMP domain-containing protein [Chloroflexi bacterium]|nr:HAMP domain-containing protein [Chloroflexota bacterium]
MRSLSFKLVLAFLATTVAGTLLAAVFLRASVARDFDDYLLGQQRDAFIAEVTTYYQATGGWHDVDDWLRDRGAGQRGPVTGDKPGGSSRGGAGGRDGPPEATSPFALVDTAGIVVVPSGRFRRGQRVTPADLARGTPVLIDGQRAGMVIPPEQPLILTLAEERFLAQADWALATAGLASIALALALGIVLAQVIARPAREMTAAAQRIAAGDLAQRVPVRSRDELGTLAAQFNTMSDDLVRATALRRQMTADIAHDLRTPLTVIAGYLEALRDQVLPPTSERFATLHDETQLLLRLVDDLHTLSLADAGDLTLTRQKVAPAQSLERVAAAYRDAAARQGVALTVAAAPDVPAVCVDPERLARVLGNLVSNALRHTPRGGRVTLDVRRAPAGVALVVADTGAGIAPEHLPNVFERFYRADEARSTHDGAGLGLAIARSLVEAHGGTLGVESQVGAGTTFTVTLPAAPAG